MNAMKYKEFLGEETGIYNQTLILWTSLLFFEGFG